jgi:hypothetical protein
VLIHLKTSTVVAHAIAAIAGRPNFWQRCITVLTALLCYAKIAPAALQRGNIGRRRRAVSETAGGKPESALSEFNPCRRASGAGIRASALLAGS